MGRSGLALLLLGAALVANLLLGAASASGAIFQVDTPADTLDASAGDGTCADASGACSLRAAVEEANAFPEADEVSIPAGVYVLTRDSLSVSGDLALRGAGAQATVIRGGRAVIRGEGGDLVVERLAITGGTFAGIFQFGGTSLVLSETTVSDNGREPCASFGGGVLSFGGLVTVTKSTVAGNACGGLLGGDAHTVTESSILGNFGPAISSPHSLVLTNSAVAGNLGNSYGVIVANSGRIENSTISGNVVANRWYCEAPGSLPCGCELGALVLGSLEIEYSTIADNSLNELSCDGPGFPVVLGGLSRLRGTVISNPGLANCGGAQESLGYNLDGDGSCGLTDPTDLSQVAPLLGPLADHGGPTLTHALLPGSPALDAIPPADCSFDDDGDPATPEEPLRSDQRRVWRPLGAGCDIGAVEVTPCSDGLDNDRDGRVDAADPGCRYGTFLRENPQCQDGLDNDGARGIDFDGGASLHGGVPLDVPDPQCTAAWRNQEASGGCGLGFELALVVPALGRLRRRGRAARVS